MQKDQTMLVGKKLQKIAALIYSQESTERKESPQLEAEIEEHMRNAFSIVQPFSISILQDLRDCLDRCFMESFYEMCKKQLQTYMQEGPSYENYDSSLYTLLSCNLKIFQGIVLILQGLEDNEKHLADQLANSPNKTSEDLEKHYSQSLSDFRSYLTQKQSEKK